MPRGVPEAPLINRFLQRVNKEGKIVSEALSNCWEWTGGLTVGYGQLLKHVWGDCYAHRWSYKHHHGEIPEGMLVRHKCDNRICVNPNHLELGTIQDNVADMRERHPQAFGRKFTEEQIKEIKTLRESGMFYKDIAEQFGCNKRTIERIFTGQHYS